MEAEWRGLSALAVHSWAQMSPPHPVDQAPDQALRERSKRVPGVLRQCRKAGQQVNAQLLSTGQQAPECACGFGGGGSASLVLPRARASGQAPPGLQLLGQSFRDELPRKAPET